jgi:hypothetical protein
VIHVAGSTGIMVSILLSLFVVSRGDSLLWFQYSVLLVVLFSSRFGIPRTPTVSYFVGRSHLLFVRNFIPVMHRLLLLLVLVASFHSVHSCTS